MFVRRTAKAEIQRASPFALERDQKWILGHACKMRETEEKFIRDPASLAISYCKMVNRLARQDQ